MCLAVPGKVLKISQQDDLNCLGKVDFSGVIKEINLSYIPEVKVGDYVIVHVGFALSILDEEEAQQTLEYLSQLEVIS